MGGLGRTRPLMALNSAHFIIRIFPLDLALNPTSELALHLSHDKIDRRLGRRLERRCGRRFGRSL